MPCAKPSDMTPVLRLCGGKAQDGDGDLLAGAPHALARCLATHGSLHMASRVVSWCHSKPMFSDLPVR